MPEFHSFRLDAVILRHSDYGEADRLLTVYSAQLGKTRALVKGARKITSRKAGHLEPFTHVKLQLAKGRDLPLVTQADTIEPYLPLREDLLLTSQAAYVIELLDRFTYEDGSENSAIFHLLTDTLGRLASGADPWVATRYYEMRLLDYLGFRPQLFECANCRREILPEDQFFSYAAGGVICRNCAPRLTGLKPITVDTLRYLRHFQRSKYADAARALPTASTRAQAEDLMQGYFTFLLERELNTPGFLKKIKS
ncbi:MAG TPA: DNA repair protein RecO [Anaerolineales bacterium]